MAPRGIRSGENEEREGGRERDGRKERKKERKKERRGGEGRRNGDGESGGVYLRPRGPPRLHSCRIKDPCSSSRTYTYLLSVRVRVSVPRERVLARTMYARGHSRSTPTHPLLLAHTYARPVAKVRSFEYRIPPVDIPNVYIYICICMYVYIYIYRNDAQCCCT